MDSETIKLVTEMADSLTTFAIMLFFIWYLIRKLDKAEGLIYSTAQRKELREEIENNKE